MPSTARPGGAPTYQWVIPLNTACFGALVRSTAGGYIAATFDARGFGIGLCRKRRFNIFTITASRRIRQLNLGTGFAVPFPSSQTNSMGDYVILKANAYGAPPLSLQWYSNNVALPNATGQVLCLNNLTNSGTNVIYVTAANNSGSPTVTNGPMNLGGAARPDSRAVGRLLRLLADGHHQRYRDSYQYARSLQRQQFQPGKYERCQCAFARCVHQRAGFPARVALPIWTASSLRLVPRQLHRVLLGKRSRQYRPGKWLRIRQYFLQQRAASFSPGILKPKHCPQQPRGLSPPGPVGAEPSA